MISKKLDKKLPFLGVVLIDLCIFLAPLPMTHTVATRHRIITIRFTIFNEKVLDLI